LLIGFGALIAFVSVGAGSVLLSCYIMNVRAYRAYRGVNEGATMRLNQNTSEVEWITPPIRVRHNVPMPQPYPNSRVPRKIKFRGLRKVNGHWVKMEDLERAREGSRRGTEETSHYHHKEGPKVPGSSEESGHEKWRESDDDNSQSDQTQPRSR
jgi:hypothetical protein